MPALSVVTPAFLAGLGATVLLAWAVCWRLRHHVLRLLPGVTVALTLTLLTGADLVNAHFGYLPYLRDVGDVVIGSGSYTRLPAADLRPARYDGTVRAHRHGGVITLAVPDDGSGFGPSQGLVYLPPQYFTEPSRRFAVVYLLHGSPGAPADWFRAGRAQQAGMVVADSDRPVIIVAPRMSHRWLDDSECVDGPHLRAETHLVRDVVPAVDRVLRTLPGPAGRALGGLSAGGYCALNLGLRHRDMFGAILDLSGLPVPTHAGGLRALFGPGFAAAAAANSPELYLPHLPPGPHPRIWLDTGRSDREVVRSMVRVSGELRTDGYEVSLHERPGSHTFDVWRSALADSVRWYAAQAARPPATPALSAGIPAKQHHLTGVA